jgi:hypothetical protein
MHPLIAGFEFQANYRNGAFRFQIRLDAASFSMSSTGPLGAAANRFFSAALAILPRAAVAPGAGFVAEHCASNSGLRIAAPDMQQTAKR